MRQNTQNGQQITKYSLAAETSPQTLINREAYNFLPDSFFRQTLIAPALEKVLYTYAQYAGGGGLPDILSVHLLAAYTVFQPLTPLATYR